MSNTSTSEQLLKLIVEKIRTDQNGFAILLRYGAQRMIVPSDDFAEDLRGLRKKAQKLLGTVLDKGDMDALLQACKTAPDNPNIVGITRPGYGAFDVAAPKYFMYPDGRAFSGSTTEIDYVAMFEPNKQAQAKGTMKQFSAGVSGIIKDQPIPIVIFFMALCPLLQPFAKLVGYNVENFVLELVGPSGTQKSTLTTMMAGALWGGDQSKLGYGRSWNTTVNAVESVCSKYNNCLLILDEATAVGATAKSRADLKFNFAHRLSLGVGKSRLGEPEGEPFTTIVFSNSNEPLLSNLVGSDEVRNAGDVRVLTYDCADPTFGYLQPAISGEDSAHPGQSLRAVLQENYGHIAPVFAEAIVGLAQANFKSFKARLKIRIEKFLDLANVDSDLGPNFPPVLGRVLGF